MTTAGKMLTHSPVMMITGVFIQKKVLLSFCLSGLGMMSPPLAGARESPQSVLRDGCPFCLEFYQIAAAGLDGCAVNVRVFALCSPRPR